MPHLDLAGVERRFDGLAVLRGVDLAVGDGEVVAVLGPSGCGKTTLLRLIAGLDAPDAGEISLGGRALSGPGVHVDAAERGVGMIFQDGALFPFLDAAHNVTFGLPRPERRSERADPWLDLVGIGGLGARRVDELSGGQRQRVALARALAPGPAVLLLDEPFANLDAALRADLRGEVRALLVERGTTAVLVTHDRAEAFALADRVAVMLDGRIAQIGTPEELLDAPVSLAVARVVGDPQELEISWGPDGWSSEIGSPEGVGPPAAGTGALAVYWPEQLEVVPGDAAAIESVTVEGATLAFGCRMASGALLVVRELRAARPGGWVPTPGTRVALRATSGPVLVTDSDRG